jgi:hypothetical protein
MKKEGRKEKIIGPRKTLIGRLAPRQHATLEHVGESEWPRDSLKMWFHRSVLVEWGMTGNVLPDSMETACFVDR